MAEKERKEMSETWVDRWRNTNKEDSLKQRKTYDGLNKKSSEAVECMFYAVSGVL